MEQLQPYLDYFALHPNWALALVFLIAMGEALLVIGLFVPSTAVLVGAGALVGAGKLPFWPIMIAAILGCVAGDQISFWAGRIYGDRLRGMWPLRNYPHLLAKGEAYVKDHGGKSIAIGRFVPGIKSVVPGIAGMFGMSQTFFLSVNVASGIVWGAMHVLPGVLLGQAISLAGELSGRLAVVLLVLLGILAIGGWLVRLLATGVSPYRKAAQGRISAWAKSSNSKSVRRFGRVIAPENPGSVLLLLIILVGFAAVVTLVDLLSGLLLRQAVGNFDRSLFNFFSELRNVPGDEIFIRITMLGDELVLYAMLAVPLLWMAFLRKWRACVAIIVTVVLAKLVLIGFSFGLPAPGLGAQHADFRFPSGHVLLAGTAFGIIAAMTARGLSRWSQALIAAGSAMAVIAVAFSRLYLGVNWFSDVAGGILISGILGVIFSVAISTISLGRFHPLALLSGSLAALLVAGGINIGANFENREERYQPFDKFSQFTQADYLANGWAKLPGQRINLIGKPAEVFVVHWLGSQQSLRDALSRNHFKLWNRWGWRDALPYLNPHVALADLSPNPAVHEGLRAKITATEDDAAPAQGRLVLRAYQTNTKVESGVATPQRVYVINITREGLKPNLGMFAVPSNQPASAEEIASVEKNLGDDPAVETLGRNDVAGHTVVILRPKS